MSYNICSKCGKPNGVVNTTIFQCDCDEPKGSDVRAWTPQVEEIRKEMMRRFSDYLSMEQIASFAYEFAPEIEARVQAATVEMRERLRKLQIEMENNWEGWRNPTPTNPTYAAITAQVHWAGKLKDVIESPLPTSALDEALLKARMKQFDEDVNAFGDSITWSQYEREYIIPKRAEMKRQLAALAQPAPEREQKG